MRERLFDRLQVPCSALCMASCLASAWLFINYHSEGRPHQPQPEVGQVHRSNDHGSFVYLTDAEATGQSLLMGLFVLGLATLSVPALKEARHPQVTLDTFKSDTYDWPLFAFYLAFYFAAIYWTGPHIVSFVVSHGIVLTWAN